MPPTARSELLLSQARQSSTCGKRRKLRPTKRLACRFRCSEPSRADLDRLEEAHQPVVCWRLAISYSSIWHPASTAIGVTPAQHTPLAPRRLNRLTYISVFWRHSNSLSTRSRRA